MLFFYVSFHSNHVKCAVALYCDKPEGLQLNGVFWFGSCIYGS